jgi:hypothetical protein
MYHFLQKEGHDEARSWSAVETLCETLLFSGKM